MIHARAAVLALLFSVLAAGPLVASDREPERYELTLVRIVDGKPEFVFVVGETGFRTVAALKTFVQALPKDSVLRWAPGCTRFGDEPLLSSAAAMEDFRRHCARHHVTFLVIPSG
jgi:hypothetical protein